MRKTERWVETGGVDEEKEEDDKKKEEEKEEEEKDIETENTLYGSSSKKQHYD